MRADPGGDMQGGSTTGEAPRAILLAVPLYRAPELLTGLVRRLIELAQELREIDATLVLINDSPDDAGLAAALAQALADLEGKVAVELLTNAANLGFVRSANRALEMALATGRDVILLNSDALPRPGAFREMAEVSRLDPLIGMVSPRSDNATICNSPVADNLRKGGADAAYAAHRLVEPHLPRLTYVPTGVGFCLLIRWLVLAEFGLFDPAYGAGYNEENDLIRRANQCGYRAVLANHAYVHHIGEASFSQSGTARAERDRANHALLVQRYPEYDQIIQRYFSGPEHRAQHVLGGLVPIEGKLRLLFDCRALGQYYSGTSEHVVALLSAFARDHADRYDIRILCEPLVFVFHGLDKVAGLRHCSEAEAVREPAAIAFRLNQPNLAAAASLAHLGAVTGALILDTIAMDCQQLDESNRESFWRDMAENMDLIGYNSAFSAAQFARRFNIPPRAVQFVSLCSVDPADYRPPSGARTGGKGILLMGNHYPHKFVRATLKMLRRAAPGTRVVCFGMESDDPTVGDSFAAGEVPPQVVDRLYAEADVLLFPSHYEGFGLPIMHALARRLPVIARDLPCAREIRQASPAGANLHLCATTEEMVRLAVAPPAWVEPLPEAEASPLNWTDAAQALATAFEEAVARFDYATCRTHQAVAIAMARQMELEKNQRVARFFRDIHSLKLARNWWTSASRSWRRGRQLRRLREAGLFDAKAYLARYPDVAAGGFDPLDHYTRFGIYEGRIG